MILIEGLTLTSIGNVISDFIGEERKTTPVNSNGPINLDLAGVQLLVAYSRENSVKIDVKLNEASVELLLKTGFHDYLNGDKFVFQER